MTIFEELLAEMRRYRELLRRGQNPILDDVPFDGGRPVCVPPMTRKSDCQNERAVAPVADSEVSAALRGTPDRYPSQPVSDHDREVDIRMWVNLKRVPGWSPDPASIVDDLRFLLRRLDDLRDSFRHPDLHSPQPPDPQPAHDWIAQLDRPYQPPI